MWKPVRRERGKGGGENVQVSASRKDRRGLGEYGGSESGGGGNLTKGGGGGGSPHSLGKTTGKEENGF